LQSVNILSELLNSPLQQARIGLVIVYDHVGRVFDGLADIFPQLNTKIVQLDSHRIECRVDDGIDLVIDERDDLGIGHLG